MARERKIAIAVVVLVAVVMIAGNGIVIYLGATTSPGIAHDNWSHNAPPLK